MAICPPVSWNFLGAPVKTARGPCLGKEQVDICVFHLLLRIYDRAPARLRRHLAACLPCRKTVVTAFALRWRTLAKPMANPARAGSSAN